jgi:hypothetical protein
MSLPEYIRKINNSHLPFVNETITFDQFKICDCLSFCDKTESWVTLSKEKQAIHSGHT